MKKVEAYQCSKCKKLFKTESQAKEHEDHCPAGEWCSLVVSKEYGETDWMINYTRYNVSIDASEESWGSIEFAWSKNGERYIVARFGITARTSLSDDLLKNELICYATPKIKELLGELEVTKVTTLLKDWKRPTDKDDTDND